MAALNSPYKETRAHAPKPCGLAAKREVHAAVADDPMHMIRTHVLRDSRQVTIRSLRPDDAPRMLDFFRQLAGESRYMRFLKWIGEPADALARSMSAIDDDRQMALVCTVASGAGEEIVGEARYIVDYCGKQCEFAIVIADRWHGSGIAGVLMAMLMLAARERGLKSMQGFVLHSNTTMLKFVRSLGFTVHPEPHDLTTVRVVKTL